MIDLYGLGTSGIPLEYSADLRRLQQQQMIAQTLMQQSQDPVQTNQMAGGFVVPVNPLQGLGKVAQAYVAARMMQGGNDGYKALGDRYAADRNAAIEKVKSAMAPAPAIPIPLANANGVEGQMVERTPAEKRAAAQEAILSNIPEVRSFGTTLNSNLQADQVLASQQAQQKMLAEEAAKDRVLQREQASQDKKDLFQMQQEAENKRDKRDFEQQKILKMMVTPQASADKAPAGYRYKPDGSLEAIPGGPADQKNTNALTGRETVSSIVGSLRDSFDQLAQGNGITDASKGGIANIQAGLSSSGLGQAIGKMTGTNNQSQRNTIAMTRPLLLQAIMKATGMSAKQMDSNAELKLYLSTATDPTLDIAANKRALDKLESLYGIGGGNAPAAPAAVPSGGLDAEKEARYQAYKKSKGL